MSVKNRRNEYNRIVKLIDEGNKTTKMPERLMEEFGKEKSTGKGKNKETHIVENKDEFEEKPEEE